MENGITGQTEQSARQELENVLGSATASRKDAVLAVVRIEDFDKCGDSGEPLLASMVSGCFEEVAKATIKPADSLISLPGGNGWFVVLVGCRLNLASVRMSQIRDRFRRNCSERFSLSFFVNYGLADATLDSGVTGEQLEERARKAMKVYRKRSMAG